jgi:NAD(P)-dependent dehydrogenase (short-subunit alcohol dehydrogenase family)
MPTANDALRVLIVGSSRGIGAALVRQYAATGWEVHATMRRPTTEKAEGDLPDGVIVHKLDLHDRAEIAALGPALVGKPLHVLIVAAGIFDRVGGAFGQGPAVPPQEVFWINAGAPMLVAETVFESLKSARPGRMVFISSAEGIRGGRRRQMGVYGQSKAALNDAVRLYADEWAWHGVIGIALHPGWVRTDMGGGRAPILPEESAAGIQQVVANLTPDHCGAFLDYHGNPLPW